MLATIHCQQSLKTSFQLISQNCRQQVSASNPLKTIGNNCQNHLSNNLFSHVSKTVIEMTRKVLLSITLLTKSLQSIFENRILNGFNMSVLRE